jgi:hypothetical protein
LVAPAASVQPWVRPVRAISFADFEGTTMRFCTDYQIEVHMDPAWFALNDETFKNLATQPAAAGNLTRTKLNQTCDSLGTTAVATCTDTSKPLKSVTHYYDVANSKKYMSVCLKANGQWHNPEAEQSQRQR